MNDKIQFAVYVFLVDNECIQYDKPCWIAVADGDIEPTGDQPYVQTPSHQTMDGESISLSYIYL